MFPPGRWLVPMFLLISNRICLIKGAQILVIAPFESLSQCLLMTPYIEALNNRGHQMTVIHAYKICKPIENVTFIRVRDNDRVYSDFEEFMGISSESNKWGEMNSMSRIMIKVFLNVLNNWEVRKLMQSNATFDLVVMEPSFTDVLYGMAAHFNAPLVGISTCVADWNLNTLVGHGTSTLEEPFMPYGSKYARNIWDRIFNWFYTTEEWLLMKLVYLPKLRLVYDHFFGHVEKGFYEIRQEFALILLNQHFSLFQARANVPRMVEVGGFHIPKEDPKLPEDLQVFIDEAAHGVIYFSLGVEQESKDLPKETQEMLFETFNSMPQRVIWKYEGEPPKSLGTNIYISELLPQRAILAHPNVKLCINHGGMLSIIESAYYGKPVLGLPLFYDQFRNLEIMEEGGAAHNLDISSVTGDVLKDTINRMISQPKYQENALAISQRFRDQPMHPLETAIYWTEYIARYKGAPHMTVSQSQVKIFEYYSLDKFLMVGIRLSLVMGIVFLLLSKGRCCLYYLTRLTKPFMPDFGFLNNNKAKS
ncbi:UDP-glycosyltransferase UGT5 [Drosophila eugracilis]|uniref:UDP-glycosyltransferase UGT5 n=1 Tax=Drosophila eugracilis TaxID=29029 RepID=UPI001BDAC1BA|nr:UDP-glycosyltransferase UGT5 [Drosophila eugracilis]